MTSRRLDIQAPLRHPAARRHSLHDALPTFPRSVATGSCHCSGGLPAAAHIDLWPEVERALRITCISRTFTSINTRTCRTPRSDLFLGLRLWRCVSAATSLGQEKRAAHTQCSVHTLSTGWGQCGLLYVCTLKNAKVNWQVLLSCFAAVWPTTSIYSPYNLCTPTLLST